MIIGMGKESLRMLMEESMMEMIIGIYTYVVDNVYDGEWKDGMWNLYVFKCFYGEWKYDNRHGIGI